MNIPLIIKLFNCRKMEIEEIVKAEEENDGKTIRLYFNDLVGLYVAYGKSAYLSTHIADPVLCYSKKLQMPVALLNKMNVFLLRQGCNKLEHEVETYYRFETKGYIGFLGYEKWAAQVIESTKFATQQK